MENEIVNVVDEDNYGPLELNLLERVELDLNRSNNGSVSKCPASMDEEARKKYSGPKEVIFVSGWANINTIYNKYIIGFVLKMVLALTLLYSLIYYNQNFLPIFLILSLASLCFVVYNIYMLQTHRNSDVKIKQIFYIDLAIMFGYLIYFLGFILIYTKLINAHFLPYFVLPHLGTALFLCCYAPRDHLYVSQKQLMILESLQLTLIAIKFSNPNFMNWHYVLFYFMCISIYLMILGMLMSIILSCSLFGFLYRDIEAWKVKSLIWMTWYYLWTGIVFIYIIKGTIMFYEELDIITVDVTFANYLGYKSFHPDMLIVAAVLLFISSSVNLIFHLLWKTEIKKYLSKVIYKKEVRKEISLRFFEKNFNFKLIQVSTTYFMKSDRAIKKEIDDSKKDEEIIENEKQISREHISIDNSSNTDKKSKYENELCVFCYEKAPNILIDPCCHGGVCKECILSYLKNDDARCPFGKEPIQKLYLLNYDKDEKQLYATGEINLRGQLIFSLCSYFYFFTFIIMEQNILHINVNNKKTLLLLGTHKGFRVHSFFNMKLLRKKEFKGGIGAIDCLETSNILAMTGGGLFPQFPTNKLIIWDDDEEKIKAEVVFKHEINAIKFKYEYLLVVCDYKIFVYSFFENLKLKHEINTIFNNKGKIETNSIDQPSIIAYSISQEEGNISQEEGVICIMNLTQGTKQNINAHNSSVKTFKLNYKGDLVATASIKGTLIRVFNVQTGKMIRSLRRGIESTIVYSMDFDYFDNWITCISNSGSLHVWRIDENQNKKKGTMTKFLQIFSNNSERNFANAKVETNSYTFVHFDQNSNVLLISYDGMFKKFALDQQSEKLQIVDQTNLLNNQLKKLIQTTLTFIIFIHLNKIQKSIDQVKKNQFLSKNSIFYNKMNTISNIQNYI